jgi:hypothetical protein
MKKLICFRAAINGTEKGKRKEGFSLPLLFDVPLEGLELVTQGTASRGPAEDAQFAAFAELKEKAKAAAWDHFRKFYRQDKPFSLSVQATHAEESEEIGYTARTEEARSFARWEA